MRSDRMLEGHERTRFGGFFIVFEMMFGGWDAACGRCYGGVFGEVMAKGLHAGAGISSFVGGGVSIFWIQQLKPRKRFSAKDGWPLKGRSPTGRLEWPGH